MIRALYVDDEPTLHEVVSRLLERQGRIQVETAFSVQEALNKLRTSHFDIIISDYDMPHLTGLDLLVSLRQKGNEIPFILFTGKERDEICIRALSTGADYYLHKSGDPQALYIELFHKITRAVDRKRMYHALQRSEKQVETLLHLLSDVNATEQSSEPTRCNEVARTVVGSAADPMTGNTIAQACFPGKDIRSLQLPSSHPPIPAGHHLSGAPDSEAILSSILTPEEIAIAVITPDERITHWNCGARRLLGYDASEVVGRLLSSLASPAHPFDLSVLRTRIQNLCSVQRTQGVFLKKDGTKVSVSLIFSPVLDRSGSLLGISVIGREKGRAEIESMIRSW